MMVTQPTSLPVHGTSYQRHFSAQVVLRVMCLALALTVHNQPSFGQTLDFTEHGLMVTLPQGWERIEALSATTVLKLARTNDTGEQARIVIGVENFPIPIDISSISREQHIAALESSTILGEKATAIDVGIATIDGVEALWGITQRYLPERGMTYEVVYEFPRETRGYTKAFTIRLSSYGDKEWFLMNAEALDNLVFSIRFQDNPIRQSDLDVMVADKASQISTGGGKPFWLALFMSYGKAFLMVLVAAIIIGTIKAIAANRKR